MKKQIIEEFKEFLKNREDRKVDDYKILRIEKEYKKDEDICKIECKIRYKMPAIYKTFFYVYTLKRSNIKWIWIMTDIQVKSYSKEH